MRRPCLNKLGGVHAGEVLREVRVPSVLGFLSTQMRTHECHHAKGVRRTVPEG